MKNSSLFCARPNLIVLTAKIQTFLGTKIQELGTDLTALLVLYRAQSPNRILILLALPSSLCLNSCLPWSVFVTGNGCYKALIQVHVILQEVKMVLRLLEHSIFFWLDCRPWVILSHAFPQGNNSWALPIMRSYQPCLLLCWGKTIGHVFIKNIRKIDDR